MHVLADMNMYQQLSALPDVSLYCVRSQFPIRQQFVIFVGQIGPHACLRHTQK